MTAYRIDLRGCAFFARHGVAPEEERLGQRFVVDARLDVEGDGIERDEIAGTVHYGEVFQEIERIVIHTRRDLIETLALDIADALLTRFAPLRSARITVHKPGAPIPGVFADVSVTVERTR